MLRILTICFAFLLPSLSVACDEYHDKICHELLQMKRCEFMIQGQTRIWLQGYYSGLERAINMYEDSNSENTCCCDFKEVDEYYNIESDKD